jgi:hypothetical protein
LSGTAPVSSSDDYDKSGELTETSWNDKNLNQAASPLFDEREDFALSAVFLGGLSSIPQSCANSEMPLVSSSDLYGGSGKLVETRGALEP